ncbi:DNA-directed RNA polymerase subunit beta [Bacillus solitudinis]|uniref:DNA-directed RNA polymerase subunit beta n=1 Tax=Bacillus solitudinis TaxID=2014074 RepID=UPI000C236049|nr:DNA-directed RNA polymerase subunit beta [Bacillus solitudinis]
MSDVQETNEPTTETAKAETREAKKAEKRKRGSKKLRIRLIPIWLRLIIVIVLVGGSLLLGLMLGYGILGGGTPADALKPETWYHILDLMRGN